MDQSYEGQAEEKGPRLSKPYLDMIRESETAFRSYQERCDTIDKRYANLDQMAEALGDREFQIFWANMEVLKPSIYQRAPRPVVDTRHTDGGEVPRKAAEILERALAYDVEADALHETLIEVRDDLAIAGRGVAWVLDDGRCIHVDRRDFVHEPARKWSEVGWIARRAWLTRERGVERFGDVFKQAKCEYVKDKNDSGNGDYRPTDKKAQVWEVWSRADQSVCWVTEGIAEVLDEQPPLIDVQGFWPCPKPAYGTTERRKLIPVPDYVYYRDQIDEINEMTARISDLAESLRLKGFYAGGASEIGEAIEAAMKATDNKALLVPVSSFAALGGQGLRDAIVWLPVQDVANVITACVELRRQLIQDVYEITGLSDIMRGATNASETATAQNLKAQYGSVRVRERQAEMIRVARDVLRIKAEVYAETVPGAELAQMAQMQFPTQQEAMMQMQQAQAAGQQAKPPVTLEQVDALLKDQKLRPFVLEVESDSTIAPNEEAEKASRIEFITAVGGFISQAGAMVAAQPQTAGFAAEMLKFTAGAFRAGRELGGAIDDFAEQIKAMAQPKQGPTPEQMAAQQAAQQAQMDAQAKDREIGIKEFEAQTRAQAKQAELALKSRELDMKEADAKAKAAAELAQMGLPADFEFGSQMQHVAAMGQAVNEIKASGEQTNAALMQSHAQLANAITALGQVMMAPKRVVRGPGGEVLGVEANGVVRMVQRGPDGELAGLAPPQGA